MSQDASIRSSSRWAGPAAPTASDPYKRTSCTIFTYKQDTIQVCNTIASKTAQDLHQVQFWLCVLAQLTLSGSIPLPTSAK
jgi:hypothetical protein